MRRDPPGAVPTPIGVQFCPLLAGAAFVQGRTLRLKSGRHEVVVNGPSRFLRALYEWCDGTRTVDEIERLAAARWGANRFVAFLHDLVDAGALIDGARVAEQAYRLAQLPSALGAPVEPERWEFERLQFHRQPHGDGATLALPSGHASALAPLLAARHSTDGFDDGEVDAAQLSALLSALYGKVAGDERGSGLARRTTPSAGAFQPLRVSLLLLRRTGDVEPGVYDVAYPDVGAVALCVAAPHSSDWVRTLTDSHRFLQACGVVVVSADPQVAALKYRNRSLHYALLEAGAALQNAGLAAADLGLGLRVLGGFYADRLSALCRLGPEQILGCAVFGHEAPTAATASVRRAMRVQWGDDALLGALHVAGAEVDSKTGIGPGWGRSTDATTALHIAMSEAIERHSFATLGTHVVGRMAELEGAIDPRCFLRYAPAQLRRADLRAHPFDPSQTYVWVPATAWLSGRRHWVPAELAYATSVLPEPFASRSLTRSTTSGCATDARLEVAIERAAFEVIERDAFARHWLEQSAGTEIREVRFDAQVAGRVARLVGEGCLVQVRVLERQLGPVVLVGIESERLGFSAVGTACGIDIDHALGRAFTEAEIVALVRLGQAAPPTIAARQVRSPTDHADLYANRRYFQRARVLTASARSETWQELVARWPSTLERRLESAESLDSLHWVDIGAADAPFGPQGKPLRSARVLIEGSLPIGFGVDAIPRGGFGPVSAAARFPHPLP